MLQKVLFIINPISGINRKPARIINWIHETWQDSGIEYEILKTGHRGHGIELAREAVKQGVNMVVAAGGDGTINEIGQGIVGSDTALGVIPAGSGNGFARNIGIPLNQRKAIKALREPVFRKIDVGRINQHYFFNIAGAGIDAVISAKFDGWRIRGIVPYILLSIREFFRFKPQPVALKLADREIRRRPMLLSFANLPEFGNNTIIAPKAQADDGLLDVCLFNPVSKLRTLFRIPRLFNGTFDQLPEVEIYRTSKVVITRDSGGPIHTDGDPHFEDHVLSVEILPNFLTVATTKDSNL